jgi:hypothetical protein
LDKKIKLDDFFNSPLLGGSILRKITFHRNPTGNLEESGKLAWRKSGSWTNRKSNLKKAGWKELS